MRRPFASDKDSTARPVRVDPVDPLVLVVQLCRPVQVDPVVQVGLQLLAFRRLLSGLAGRVVLVVLGCLAGPSVRVVPCHRLGRAGLAVPSRLACRLDQRVQVVLVDLAVQQHQACQVVRQVLGVQPVHLVQRVLACLRRPLDQLGKLCIAPPCWSVRVGSFLAFQRHQAHHRHHSLHRGLVHQGGRAVLRGTCSVHYTGTGRQPDERHVVRRGWASRPLDDRR